MPRHVDADQRRYEVAQAVWRVILRAGLARASVRAVAQEAGLSVGSLRHYFSTQRELQVYSLQLINERAHERYTAVDRSLPVRERVESSMWAVLPVTPEQVEEHQVWLAFRNESATDPELAELVAEDRAMSLGLARQAVTALRDAGQTNPGIDVEAAATELVALFDGLCLAAVLTPDDMPAAKLQDTVIGWLDALATRRVERGSR